MMRKYKICSKLGDIVLSVGALLMLILSGADIHNDPDAGAIALIRLTIICISIIVTGLTLINLQKVEGAVLTTVVFIGSFIYDHTSIRSTGIKHCHKVLSTHKTFDRCYAAYNEYIESLHTM